MSEKHVYRFGKDENGDNVTEVAGATVDEAKWITGGKGANLAEMANIGLPVPPGFSITCQTCVAYRRQGRPAARLRSFRRSVLHARHDGHGP